MDTQEVSDTTFGLFIAYVLPGLTVLYGIPFDFVHAADWAPLLNQPNSTVPQLLLVLVQSVAIGLTVSTVRWLVVDTLHHRTGVRSSRWDFGALERSVAAFELLIHIHYRYYKFYANMVVALVWAYCSGGYASGWWGIAYWVLAALFFLGSRDALQKYYERAGRLLGPSA